MSFRAPLPSFQVIDTVNPETVIKAVHTNFHPVMVELKEPYSRVQFNSLDLGRVSINGASFLGGYQILSDPTPGSFLVNLLSAGGLHIGHGREQFACTPGGMATVLDFSQRTSIRQETGYVNHSLRYLRNGVESFLSDLTGEQLREQVVFKNPIDLSQPGPSRFAEIVRHVAGILNKDPGLARAPLLLSRYEELLLSAMLTCLEHNHSHVLTLEPKPVPPKIVRLAEAYIEANADKPLKLSELVSVTGKGARSLQLTFQKFRGYSLSNFLKECRLRTARQLLSAAQPGSSVTSISLECGFPSQSLFSKQYRERFGEKPSETLRRG